MRGQEQAIKQGKVPMRLIPGLRRAGDGKYRACPKHEAVPTKAFKLRLGGATIQVVRAHLAAHGIQRSYNGTKSLLRSPQAMGEVVYRGHRFPAPSLIDRETWRQVQRIKVPRGRKPKSERLLARQGVLRGVTAAPAWSSGCRPSPRLRQRGARAGKALSIRSTGAVLTVATARKASPLLPPRSSRSCPMRCARPSPISRAGLRPRTTSGMPQPSSTKLRPNLTR